MSSLVMVAGVNSTAALSAPLAPQANAAVAVNQVNLNQASAEELALNLTGVGLKRAQAIVELREKLGGFSDIKQLLQVKGIGPRMLELNQERMIL
ncbi:DNA uptake protein [Pseudidiomarina taiwanensis]|uniref:DNA uptake protein n=2 Tax=Pseudidiomarina taiwanensis TaxID=337250 RepID=A0A432ZP59_9GAMM|nr:DNA uptake protein [Pseudidiomarina taiwanensis]